MNAHEQHLLVGCTDFVGLGITMLLSDEWWCGRSSSFDSRCSTRNLEANTDNIRKFITTLSSTPAVMALPRNSEFKPKCSVHSDRAIPYIKNYCMD